EALKKTDAPLKHIVVLGDGDAQPPPGQDDTQNVLTALKEQDITTSAIGIDTHNQAPFMAYMQDLARWGGGRFYESNDPSQVPQLFLKESQVALRPWFEQDPFFPKVTAGGDLLQGVPLDAFPELGGYVVTTAKPGSEVYFTSPKQDPVLAAGSYGLGRSVAWTSDSTGHWTGGFLRSPVSATLFAKMVDWTLPAAGPEQLTVEARPSGDSIQLTVAALWPLDGAMRRLTLTPRQLASLAAAIVTRRRPLEVEVVVPELARLRGRVAGVRRRRAVPAPRSVMTGPPEPLREVAAPT